MDSFNQYPSGSDSSGNSASFGSGYSDVKLASSNPKKRAGRKKFKETRHPVYRGIRLRNNDKWVCELREPTQQKRVWLGTYPTAEMAARAHDVAALAFRGKSACLNFADSSWRLPHPASQSPKDIRKAAGEAAEIFRRMSREDHHQASETNQAGLKVSEDCNDDDDKVVTRREDMTRWSENMFSMDEDLHGLLLDMADGLMIDPPRFGDYARFDDDVMITGGDVSLWSYSF